MKRLIFATNNRHKVEEARAALAGVVEIMTLAEAGLSGEIPETAETLEGNALQKAQWVWERVTSDQWPMTSGYDGVFADDTGLEVEALGGAPGVYSARYAGEHCSFDDNIDKLLAALDGETNRRACFRTVICLIEGERLKMNCGRRPCGAKGEKVAADNTSHLSAFTYHLFEGRVDGQILTERHTLGEGFGYDPVFMPDRFALSFAEMPLDVKNRISHRGLALKKLTQYLRTQ